MNVSKKLGVLLIYSFFGVLVSSLIAFPAEAQTTPLNLTAYPATISINAKPDTTVTEKFRVRNNTDTPLELTVSVKKLAPNIQGDTTIEEFSKNDSYQQWISFDQTAINALPREWTDVAFSIKVPKDTAFGYYYALYLAPKEVGQNSTQPHATLTGSLAIPVLLTVDKPGATINGKLLSFAGTAFSEFLPVTFLTTLSNTGNLHIRPTGNIFIKDWTGSLVDTLIINNSGGSILPNGKRDYATVWDNSFITQEQIMQDDTVLRDSNGNPKTHLVFHWDKVLSLRIGKYTATALVVIPTQTRDISFQTTTTFWVFPWKAVGIVIVFFLLAGVGLINTGKSIVKTIQQLFKRKS